MDITENTEHKDIITVYGVFRDNFLISIETLEIYKCLAYGIIREKINYSIGYFNLEWRPSFGCYVIFQYYLDNN